MGAEPLTFEIRLSRGDLMRYFLLHHYWDRWITWLAALAVSVWIAWEYWSVGGFAYALLFFVVAFVIMLVGMWLFGALLYGLRLWRLPDDGLVLEAKQVEVEPEGFTVTGSQTEAHFLWGKIERVKRSGAFLFLALHGADMVIPWPRRQLPPGAAESIEGWWRSATADSTA